MIGIYVRVSSEMQRDNYSVAAQKDKGKTFAMLMKDTYEIYDDTESGSTITERKEFSRLLNDIKLNRITTVWAIEFSRLSRSLDDALEIRKIFVKHNVQLYVGDQLLDISSPEAVLSYNLKSSVAEFERSNIIARVKRAKRQQQDSGEFVHSAILGYTSKFTEAGERIWMIDEHEAEIVRTIFTMYADGQALHKIADYLNVNGFKTKRNRQFKAPTISKILTHPEYYGKTKDANDKLIASKVYKPIIDERYSSIISDAKLARTVTSDKFRASKNALSNILKCGRCGAPYYVHRAETKNKRSGTVTLREHYAHRGDTAIQRACEQEYKYINKFHLEKLAELCYYYLFRNQKMILEYAKKRKAEIFTEEASIIKRIEEQDLVLEEIEKKRQRLVDAVRDGVLSIEDIRSSVSELNQEKSKIEAIKKTLESSIQTLEMKSDDSIREFVFANVGSFIDMDEARKKLIYKEIFEKFTIDGEVILVRFFFGLELCFNYLDIKEGKYEDMDSFYQIAPQMFKW